MTELYTNIQTDYGNFCIGPVAGTFCSVNISADPVVMSVKNTDGDLIRNYEFLPNGILGPPATSYPIKTVVDIEYTGPKNQNVFYTGAIFYTFERVLQGTYLYNVGGVYQELAYSDRFIIRKWLLNEDNFTLNLQNTWTKISDVDNYFDCYTFAVEYFESTLSSSVTTGTGVINLTTVSGLNKYDTILIGPSSDTDNLGKVEEVYIHAIDGNSIYIRTYDNYTPTMYEYVNGDPITVIKDFFVCSDPEPLVVDNKVEAYKHSYGYAYKLSQKDYASVLLKSNSGMFKDVTAACWNYYYQAFTFVKGSNLLSINATNLALLKSQKIENINADDNSFLLIFDIQINNTDIYLLQNKVYKRDDYGDSLIYSWSSYNYQIDSLIPYVFSIDVSISPTHILWQNDLVDVTVIVRDQFGMGVFNKTVNLYKEGDALSEFTPSDGVVVTDVNGVCTLTYRSGTSYKGLANISARVNGGNSSHGSVYVWTDLNVVTGYNVEVLSKPIVQIGGTTMLDDSVHIPQILGLEEDLHLTCLRNFAFPGGHVDIPRPYTNTNIANALIGIDVSILSQLHFPKVYLTPPTGDLGLPFQLTTFENAFIIQSSSKDASSIISSIQEDQGFTPLTQLSSSRRLHDLNVITSTLDQFLFIQDAIPSFWSEKNPVDTSYWIRLRPFAFSLNTDTLVVKFREINKLKKYDSGWYNIETLGITSVYDAGGGLFGIDFNYQTDTFFNNDSIVYVYLEVYDLAPIPNYIFIEYWFKVVPDFKAPYIYDLVPYRDQVNVPVDTSISFMVADNGAGVDITSAELLINNNRASFNYTKFSNNLFSITYQPTKPFRFGDTVNVYFKVKDSSSSENILIDSWHFYTPMSTPPWFDKYNYLPKPCSQGVSRYNNDISFQVYGVGGGVDISSLIVHIGGKERQVTITPIIYRVD